MIRHVASIEFLRFLFVGGLAALIHWSARYLMSRWLPFSMAVVLAYFVGMGVAFLLTRMWVFPGSTRGSREQLRDFVLTNAAFFPVVWISAIGINALLLRMGITIHSEDIAHGIAIALPMVGTFFVYKFIAFKSE